MSVLKESQLILVAMAMAMTELLTERMVERDLESSGAHFVSHQYTVIDTQITGSQIFCLNTSKL